MSSSWKRLKTHSVGGARACERSSEKKLKTTSFSRQAVQTTFSEVSAVTKHEMVNAISGTSSSLCVLLFSRALAVDLCKDCHHGLDTYTN
jgi:hypothetical protein